MRAIMASARPGSASQAGAVIGVSTAPGQMVFDQIPFAAIEGLDGQFDDELIGRDMAHQDGCSGTAGA